MLLLNKVVTGGGANFTYLQRVTVSGYTGAARTTTAIDTGQVATSNATVLFVACQQNYQDSSGHGVSDSKGCTWNPVTTTNSASGSARCWMHWAVPTGDSQRGSGHTFTTQAQLPCFEVLCFGSATPPSGTGALDQQNSNPGSSVSTLKANSITPGSANELVIATTAFDLGNGQSISSTLTGTGGGSFIVPSGCSIVSVGGSNIAGACAYLIQTTATLVDPVWAATQSGSAIALIASFKSS